MTQSLKARVTRHALLTGVPLSALAVAAFATRGPQPVAGMQGHDHSASAPVTARPVMLSSDAAQRIGVTFAVATEEALQHEVRAAGQIVVDETRVQVISPRLDGWVERLHVNATGQQVSAGEPVLEVFSPMLATAQEELLLAKQLQAKMAGDSAAHVRATSLVAAARARLAAWGIAGQDIARIESEGAQHAVVLRSSASGFVTEKSVVQGQRIMAGDALYRVVDLLRVWLEADVYEQDAAAVRIGQTATAELQALPGRPLSGRVVYVYPTLDTETRTVRIRVELPNARLALKPGMAATVRLATPSDARALTVPRAAVLATGERNLVFLKRADGMFEPRVVQTGRVTDERIEILGGLLRGDTIVASATFLVDAESSLGTALGGMGNMPGMDIAPPRKRN